AHGHVPRLAPLFSPLFSPFFTSLFSSFTPLLPARFDVIDFRLAPALVPETPRASKRNREEHVGDGGGQQVTCVGWYFHERST
ncbi:MAG: hypothetical protein M3O46_11845, partial [Myxococcota bacterium]|nr:hypothetical protein [Myxococcota bacterium]